MQTQAHHQQFLGTLTGCQNLLGLGRMARLFGLRQPLRRFGNLMRCQKLPIQRQAAVGSGTDPGIIAPLPIQKVMARFLPGRCMVGNFIGRQSRLSTQLLGHIPQGLGVFVYWKGEIAACQPWREGRSFLDSQLVQRQMPRVHRQRLQSRPIGNHERPPGRCSGSSLERHGQPGRRRSRQRHAPLPAGTRHHAVAARHPVRRRRQATHRRR